MQIKKINIHIWEIERIYLDYLVHFKLILFILAEITNPYQSSFDFYEYFATKMKHNG